MAPTRDAAVALDDQPAVIIETGLPALGERREAWAAFSGTDDVDDVAAKFRLSVRQIADASEIARIAAAGRGEDVPDARRPRPRRAQRVEQPHRRARRAARAEVRLGRSGAAGEAARGAALDLLVRPPPRPGAGRVGLRAHRRARPGLKVMFAGEPGTGKTMAAQVLARELGLELYRIDLATVVSKYIGETEKNLDRVFDAAAGSNAILFFDEADALFGKRSEVRTRTTATPTSRSPTCCRRWRATRARSILATNFRQNIDDAFLRRLDFVIDFPFPEPEDRELIWRQLLPEDAPLSGDVDLAVPGRPVQALRRRHPQLLAGGRVPGGRGGRRDRHAPPRARRRAGVREAGPARRSSPTSSASTSSMRAALAGAA